ncbi:cathepsin O-like [Daktulosphaira vitifoliae]|uniref:cathepsin O-like n=1 Tax=Daktulosphaira vitifoliae TaxID=58002 RepID=UPI0021A989DF|nr:cathepsin O-like [Daktulosphaira vitifoliae]
MYTKSFVLKVLLLIIFFVFVTYNLYHTFVEQQYQKKFENFMNKYNKSYTNETERNMRFKRFQKSLSIIEQLNKDHSDFTYYGITKFSDLSPEEFVSRHLSIKGKKKKELRDTKFKRSITAVTLETIDWRNEGVVNSVRNQKTCGACWAISVVEIIESVYAIKTGSLKTLSVQEALDCSDGINQGCLGGSPAILLQWLVKNNITLQTEERYPTIYENQICKINKSINESDGIRVVSFISLNLFNREDLLLSYIMKSPVAVAVNAIPWQYYVGGIVRHCENNLSSLNHAVEIVGYVLGENPYYIIKNSWGTDHGIDGYIYVGIGDNECGIGWEVDVVLNVV